MTMQSITTDQIKPSIRESIMAIEPLTIHITWIFPPGQLSKFYDALYPLKEKLILEDECVYFNAFAIHGKPGFVRMVEIWDCDMDWMVEVILNASFQVI